MAYVQWENRNRDLFLDEANMSTALTISIWVSDLIDLTCSEVKIYCILVKDFSVIDKNVYLYKNIYYKSVVCYLPLSLSYQNNWSVGKYEGVLSAGK